MEFPELVTVWHSKKVHHTPNLAEIRHNERIVGKALRDVRDNVILATKLFLGRSEEGG